MVPVLVFAPVEPLWVLDQGQGHDCLPLPSTLDNMNLAIAFKVSHNKDITNANLLEMPGCLC